MITSLVFVLVSAGLSCAMHRHPSKVLPIVATIALLGCAEAEDPGRVDHELSTSSERHGTAEPVAIMSANLLSDRTIDLQLDASSASELETQVREDEGVVVVSVVRTNPPAPGEPKRTDITSTRIELETPLGNRPLHDAATGAAVPVRSADAPS